MEHYIEDSLHYKIQDYCVYNKLDLNEYINDCIVKQFNIDRYGDLNVIIGTKEEKRQEEKTFILNEVKLDNEKKNIIITHNLGEDVIIPLTVFPIIENKTIEKNEFENISEIENSIIIEENKEKEIDTNKRKKRTLRTK